MDIVQNSVVPEHDHDVGSAAEHQNITTLRVKMKWLLRAFMLDDENNIHLSESEKNERFWDRQW